MSLPAQRLTLITHTKNKDTHFGNVSLKISKGRSAYKSSAAAALYPVESSECSDSCAESLEEETEGEERGKEKQAERESRRGWRSSDSPVGMFYFLTSTTSPALPGFITLLCCNAQCVTTLLMCSPDTPSSCCSWCVSFLQVEPAAAS